MADESVVEGSDGVVPRGSVERVVRRWAAEVAGSRPAAAEVAGSRTAAAEVAGSRAAAAEVLGPWPHGSGVPARPGRLRARWWGPGGAPVLPALPQVRGRLSGRPPAARGPARVRDAEVRLRPVLSRPARPAGSAVVLTLGLALALGGLVLPGALLRPLPAVAGEGWHWPVDPPRAVVRRFAPGPTRYSPGHYGVDLRAAVGRPVRAVGAGRVTYSGLLAGRGVVVVDHGGVRTTYEPLDRVVRLGQEVPAGTVLGTLTTGHACSPSCLHLGLRRGDEYLDPMTLFGGLPRLLPQGGRAGAGVGSRRAGGAVPAGRGLARAAGTVPVAAPPASGAAAPPLPSSSGSRAGAPPEGLDTVSAVRPAPSGTAPGGASTPPAALEDSPWWRRVGAEGPQATAALLALVAGLVLVRRPSSPAPQGGSAGGVVRPVVVAPDDLPWPVAALAGPSPLPPEDGSLPADRDLRGAVPLEAAAPEPRDAQVVELDAWRARRSS